MSFTCNPELRAILNSVPDKLQWAAAIANAMGNNRRIRCFRDPNPSALDPITTGVEYRNVGSAGAFTTAAGVITKLGRINGTTIQLAADIYSGTHALRVEGNGHWFAGSLGPSAAAQIANGVPAGSVVPYDFTVGKNFTASNGFGIASSLVISGPRYLPSGIGTSAPALTASAPHTIEVWNYTNPAAAFLAGSCTIDTRDDDFVYQDAEMAADVGDAGIYTCSQVAMHGEHAFAGTLFVSSPANKEVIDGEPLYELLISATHAGSWTTYPERGTWDPANHVNFPDAFKIAIKDAAGNTLYTHQMHDGSAINSKRMRVGDRNETTAMQPNWNTGMQLPWRNGRPRRTDKANKWYTGLTADSQRPTRARQHYTFIGVEPLITGGYSNNSVNGIHHIFGQPKWPLPNANYYPAVPDPYLVEGSTGFWPGKTYWIDGWGYEPGSFSGHNWYTGPGGPRNDRGFIPSIIAMYLSNPNGVIPQDNVPLADRAHDWCLAYSNHSHHWVSDPRTMQLTADNDEWFDRWAFASNYYGDKDLTGYKVIDVRASMREGEQPWHVDKNNQFYWSGWGRDPLHSYGCAGWGALSFKSPMLAAQSKFDTTYQWMQEPGLPDNFKDFYMVRSQAWLWLHMTVGWKLASTHRLGITRDQIEARFGRHLAKIHDNLYVPAMVQNVDAPEYNGIRNLGCTITQDGGSATESYFTPGGHLGFYMAGVLALMKQTGFWSQMKAKGGKSQIALEFQIRNMDKFCFDWTLDTGMQGGWPYTWGLSRYPTKWSDYWPATGQEDAVTNSDGSIKNGEPEVSFHQFSMYPFIRRDFFPEYPHPRLDAAVAKWQNILDKAANHVAGISDPVNKRNADFAYGMACISPIKAPTELGPA